MHIVVDIGNTRIKTGEFDGSELRHTRTFREMDECREYLEGATFEAAIVSSVADDGAGLIQNTRLKEKTLFFTHDTPIPLELAYKTPATLGLDRLAAACGAAITCPGEHCLVVDAGTSITYEFVEAGRVYRGGAISPGLRMRAQALHNFTAKLPLIQLPEEAPLIGNDTKSCLESGVLNGAKAEIRDFIRMYREKFSNLRIIICGGDAKFFKSVSHFPVLIIPGLVLLGLNAILNYNVQKNG